jgi:hypothetical protein
MLVLWSTQGAHQLAADTWLNLLGGREILAHGLPYHDTLAIISRGYDWIDQQWLANLAYYGLYTLGGKALVATANVVVFTSGCALAFLFARRSGAPALHVAMFGVPAAFIAPQFARAEVLVQPLFVILIALLATESRKKTRRIVFAFPILALWANLHGSVVMAALLVAAVGAIEGGRLIKARDASKTAAARALLLLIAPWPFVFASPYGLHLLTYYRATLHNSEFAKFLTEWAPPKFGSPWGLTFFVVAGVAIFLIGRHRGVLTSFEVTALAVTAYGALVAARSIVWFTYAAAVILPRFFRDAKTRERSGSEQRLLAATTALAIALAALAVTVSVARPSSALATTRGQRALDGLAHVLRADRHARVFASYDTADWLLFNLPAVRGRIAYDGRWEILPQREMQILVRYLWQTTPEWEQPSQGYRLIVLNPEGQPLIVRTYRARRSMRLLYEDEHVIVFDRGTQSDSR